MDELQQLITEQGSSAQIIGVNEHGFEANNSGFTEGRSLPWLQDTSDARVWDVWGVTYRDLFIVDSEGVLRNIYNLSSNDLRSDAATAELLDLVGALEEMTFDASTAQSPEDGEEDTGESGEEDTGAGNEERTEETRD